MRQPGGERQIRGKTIAAVALCLWLGAGADAAAQPAETAAPAKTFASAQEAYRVGQAFIRSKNLKEGQTALEQALALKLAAVGEHLRPFHFKEAAVAWLKAQDKQKALITARTAIAGPADMRTDLLPHSWHRHLGEVFLATGEYRLAIEQLEKAIAKATVEGYKRECEKKLEEARKALSS